MPDRILAGLPFIKIGRGPIMNEPCPNYPVPEVRREEGADGKVPVNGSRPCGEDFRLRQMIANTPIISTAAITTNIRFLH